MSLEVLARMYITYMPRAIIKMPYSYHQYNFSISHVHSLEQCHGCS